jgi:hypothetical protein
MLTGISEKKGISHCQTLDWCFLRKLIQFQVFCAGKQNIAA